NWDLVDISCRDIVGAFLDGKSKKPLYTFAKSRNLWERRIAIISTLHYIKNGQLDDTFKIAALLLGDKEDLLNKAAGWMLREAGKKDIAAEKAFIKEHYGKMPRTMLRYAIERFPPAERKKYLSGTI
ncbi:MAG: DNA alkylation repair protein, partial [Elusimicrobiaceae bacterium]